MTPTATYPHEVPPTGASAAFAADLRARLPQLDTERLTLRAPRVEDFPTFAEIMLSERGRYLVGNPPATRDRAWLEFAQCTAGWLLRGYGMWTIVARETEKPLGFVLVLMEPGDREPELGWFITQEAEGHGYAFEAAQAARDYALNTLNLPALVSYVDPPNTRSIALAERLNAPRDTAAAATFDEPVLVFRHAPREALQ